MEGKLEKESVLKVNLHTSNGVWWARKHEVKEMESKDPKLEAWSFEVWRPEESGLWTAIARIRAQGFELAEDFLVDDRESCVELMAAKSEEMWSHFDYVICLDSLPSNASWSTHFPFSSSPRHRIGYITKKLDHPQSLSHRPLFSSAAQSTYPSVCPIASWERSVLTLR